MPEPRPFECDPVTGDRYRDLLWKQIGLDYLAEPKRRQTVAITHWQVVEQARGGSTAAERLSLLGTAIAEVYNGLEPADGEALVLGWRTLLADLASCSPEARAGWVALYGESTGAWWPPRSSLITRGLVNAVLRSPEVEVLHASSDRVTFYDNQLGTFCANWAAVSLLNKLLDLDNPDLWGLEEADFARAAEHPRFSDALTRFPAAAALVAAAGRCSSARTRRAAVVLPDEGSGREATGWLDTHAGAAHAPKAGGAYAFPDAVKQQHVSVRNAWTAPPSAELEQFVGKVFVVPTLTRLSRDPRHLAAALQWAVRSDVPLLSPNLLIQPDAVNLRRPLVGAPSADISPGSGQATHEASWSNLSGLSDEHAALLKDLFPQSGTAAVRRPAPPAKLRRNELCWCGSGKKYKRCHLQPSS